ncbi:O-antigen ligase family protein [Cytobacillus spongiae]|uniref:O-antigen ligase family protein n=1 Tax=Cytobacillus spongiae TaxID=2901381 RepID=UPI001F218A6C|nr:O-antigen ligase family protein [Cytobacillus spongiae]UII55684.1 O-antigen ligase family protein [Cytobacillus spongiae]
MENNNKLTYYFVLASLFLIPIVYFKAYIGPIPLSVEIILIPLVTLAAVYEFFKGRLRFNQLRIWPLAGAFALFLLISLVSIVNAVDLKAAIMEIARYLSYVVLFLIVAKVDFSKKQYMGFFKAFGAAVIIVGLFGVLQYIFNFSLNKAGLYALQDAKGRVDSTLVNPNYFSAYLNFIIPTLLLLSVVYLKNRAAQLFMFAIYAIYVIDVILTYTRAAWVTMACAFILAVILIPKLFFKNVIKPHILISFLVLFTVVFFMPDFQSRTSSALYAIEKLIPIGSPGAGDNGDLAGEEIDEEDQEEIDEEDSTTNKAVVSRITLWKTGWYMLKDNPVLGVGMGNYYARYKDYVTKYPELDIGHDSYSVHNSYLKVGAETGFIGLVSFLLIYILYFLMIIKLYFKQNVLGKVLSVGLFAGSVCYMVQNLSNNLIFIPQLNVIFWLVAGLMLAFLYRNQQEHMGAKPY